MRLKLLMLLLGILIINACSSVNNLKDYDLVGKTFYFDEVIGKNANQIIISDNYNYSNQQNKSSTEKALDIIGNIGTAIGKSLTESEVREKIERNSNPKDIVNSVSKGIEKTLIQYLNIKIEDNLQGEYDYIVTTTLEEVALRSGTYGTYINVEVLCTITSRKDGKIVWQQSESESVTLRGQSTSSSDSKILKDISQIAALASLTDAEIKTAIENASLEVGRNIANDLREDLSNVKR